MKITSTMMNWIYRTRPRSLVSEGPTDAAARTRDVAATPEGGQPAHHDDDDERETPWTEVVE